jgi:colanic acid biosynthesis glycosyl transferase WcaI
MAMCPRVIFVNKFFAPDQSATSRLLTQLTQDLQMDFEIHVIASQQLYNDQKCRLAPFETMGRVQVHRVSGTRLGRANLVSRAVDALAFHISVGAALIRLLRSDDVVVVKTDPPLISVSVALCCKLKGARQINWLQDVFPEVAEVLGVRFARGSFGRFLRALRNASLHFASVNVVLGDRMADLVRAQCYRSQREILVIPNWADGKQIYPLATRESTLRSRWGLEGKFVVAYSGNLGRAHEFDTIVGAIRELHTLGEDVTFLFVGHGAQYEALKRAVAAHGLIDKVCFQPFQPEELLCASLSVADVHLVCLLPDLEGLIVPSKFYGIAAAGRPTIFVGDVLGEIARIVRVHQCGVAVSTGNIAGLVAAISQFKGDEQLRRLFGERARTLFESNFDRPVCTSQWRQAVARVLSRRA